jgi:hypothetical protein
VENKISETEGEYEAAKMLSYAFTFWTGTVG